MQSAPIHLLIAPICAPGEAGIAPTYPPPSPPPPFHVPLLHARLGTTHPKQPTSNVVVSDASQRRRVPTSSIVVPIHNIQHLHSRKNEQTKNSYGLLHGFIRHIACCCCRWSLWVSPYSDERLPTDYGEGWVEREACDGGGWAWGSLRKPGLWKSLRSLRSLGGL